MRSRIVSSETWVAVALVTTLVMLQACSDRQPTDVSPSIDLARGGGGSNGPDPEVVAADPSEAPQNTTLDVHVLGKNFDDGSTVRFLLNGKPTKDIKINSTQFVNDGDLLANITIALDADTAKYDIEVTTSNKRRGIGTELFEVTIKKSPTSGFLTISGGLTASTQRVSIRDGENILRFHADEEEDYLMTYGMALTATHSAGFTGGVCEMGQKNQADPDFAALFDQLIDGPRLRRLWVEIDKNALGVPSEESGMSIRWVDADREYMVSVGEISPTEPGASIITMTGSLTTGLTITSTGGRVRVRDWSGRTNQYYNITCPRHADDAITMVLTLAPN